jgi:hypothetical protein
LALDEYRFQVNLNASRTQYYFVLNVGIIGVATSLLKFGEAGQPGNRLVALIYIAGLLCCLLSLAASVVQRGYYQAARNHKKDIEAELGLGDLSIITTPGMGSVISRIGRVTTFNYVLLSALSIIDLAGCVAALRA